jgi:hypothetical protein
MIHTEETKRKLSEMRTGENNPFYGKHHTEETKNKLAKATRAYNFSRAYEIAPFSLHIPSSQEVAYIAGIIDGEGSIVLRHRKSGTREKDIYPSVMVYNNSKELMDWLVASIGGTYRLSDKRGREPGYTWQITAAKDVFTFLNFIIPHLLIKHQKAVEARDYLNEKYGEKLWE